MGAKTSKSANISATPKKGEVAAVEGENHVNGVAADVKVELKDSNNTNHVAEVAKEEVKEVVEAATDAKVENKEAETETPASPEVAVNGTADEKENKTPVKEGEEKPEKKKVTKRFSLRKLSFLRKEKKVKEDKQKNGEVTSPEKKEEKKEGEVVVNGDGGEAKPAEEIKSDEIKKDDEAPAVEKVEPTEPAKIEEPKVEEKKTEAVVAPTENGETFTETVTKEVAEISEKKIEPAIEIATTNGIKEVNDIISAVENGIDEKLSKEVAVSE